MSEQTVIDLYVPAHSISMVEAATAAHRRGVDAVVWVVDDPELLPEPAEVKAVGRADGHAWVYPACVATGPGYRYLLLVPGWSDTPVFKALEALDSASAVLAAIAEVGGCAVPVGPRHANEATVNREVTPLPEGPGVGVLALLAGGQLMARDLDIEAARAAGRRVLAGTGPFGTAEQIGRFATLLPAPADSLRGLLQKLASGCGIALEMSSAEPRPERKKRRRRRRGKRRQGEGADDGGGADTDD